jgi:hypothetical protein
MKQVAIQQAVSSLFLLFYDSAPIFLPLLPSCGKHYKQLGSSGWIGTLKLFSGPWSKSDAICDLEPRDGITHRLTERSRRGTAFNFNKCFVVSLGEETVAPSCVPLTTKFHGERLIKHRPKSFTPEKKKG